MKLSPIATRLLKAIEIARDKDPVERTRPALAATVFCAPIYAGAVLADLHKAKLIHVESWAHHTRRGPLTPVWALGDDEDAICPKAPAKNENVDWRNRPAGLRVAKWLQDGNSGTSMQLAAACHIAEVTAWHMVARMRQEGLVRIAKYEQQFGPVAVYAWVMPKGSRNDAKKPARLTVTQWRHRRRDQLIAKYGPEAATHICNAMFRQHGPITVVVDGRPVYRRGEGMLERLDA